MTKKIGISIGALSDPIFKQLRNQGVNVKADDVSHFQRALDGVIQLKFLGCISDSETKKIEQKLVNKIGKFCEKFIKG